MNNATDTTLELSQCVWCSTPLHGAEQSVTVRPPQRTESTFHEWKLHLECAREWTETVDRVARLRLLGAGATLLTAAEHDGIEALLSDDDLELIQPESGDPPLQADSARDELKPR